jgi:hypothetical protein
MYILPRQNIHVFISTHIRTQPRNPCIYFHTHTYTASESRRDRKHTCMHVHTHTCKTESRPNQKSPRSRGEDGQGQGVVEIRARLRDSSAKRGSNTGPFCGVSRAASTGHSGQIPRGGRTGRLELRARLRGSRSNGVRTHARCFPQAGFERTRVECVVGSDPPQALFTGPPQRKSVTSESNTQPLCSRSTKYKATECLSARLPSA